MNTRIKLTTSLAALAALGIGGIAAAPGCSELQKAQSELCCSEFVPGNDLSSVNWGLSGNAELNYGALMQAIADFSATATSTVTDVSNACQAIAVDLGVDPGAVTATNPGERAKQWCSQAVTAIGSTDVSISFQPPSCTVNASVQASCEGKCSASAECEITPAEIIARCEPGKLAGKCEGSCTGSCTGSANLAVNCEGTCSGTCTGTCDGTCSKTTPGGTECNGECDGTCTGECRGSCELAANANVQCNGECSGSCDVEFTAPKCEGSLSPPKAECQVNAECNASCSASASAKAECKEPSVAITSSNPNLVATLEANLPKLLVVAEAKGNLLLGQAEAVLNAAGNASFDSTKSIACLIPAGAAIESAVGNIEASLSASVSVVATVN